MTFLMKITEEKWLLTIFGKEHENYKTTTFSYFGIIVLPECLIVFRNIVSSIHLSYVNATIKISKMGCAHIR